MHAPIIPIPTSARLPIEYIPAPQDADRLERAKREELRGARRALDQRITAYDIKRRDGRMDVERDNADSADEASEIQAEGERLRREEQELDTTLAAMRAKYPQPQRFLLSIPTATDRDQVNGRLIQLGLRQITQEQLRALLIEELFEHDWGKGDRAANEAEAEEIANFLDGCWMRQEAHNDAIQRWQEQEIERTLDEANGALPRPRADLPPKVLTVRENARLNVLVETMMAGNQRLRDAAAMMNDFTRRVQITQARIHIIGVQNVDLGFELVRDPRTNALPEEAVLALREKVDDASWRDLVGFINRMYALTETEVKNFDSPPVSLSPPSGSPAPSDDTTASGGSSMILSTVPLPSDVSETIIERSSGSGHAIEDGEATSERWSSPTPGQ
jgi:hypothetical protein